MRQCLAVLALLTGSASAQAWEPISHGPAGLFVGFMPRALAIGPDPSAARERLTATPAAAGSARATVHDLLGRTVAVLAEGPRPAGPLRLDADLGGLASGVYHVRLAAEGRVATRRMTIFR